MSLSKTRNPKLLLMLQHQSMNTNVSMNDPHEQRAPCEVVTATSVWMCVNGWTQNLYCQSAFSYQWWLEKVLYKHYIFSHFLCIQPSYAPHLSYEPDFMKFYSYDKMKEQKPWLRGGKGEKSCRSRSSAWEYLTVSRKALTKECPLVCCYPCV